VAQPRRPWVPRERTAHASAGSASPATAGCSRSRPASRSRSREPQGPYPCVPPSCSVLLLLALRAAQDASPVRVVLLGVVRLQLLGVEGGAKHLQLVPQGRVRGLEPRRRE